MLYIRVSCCALMLGVTLFFPDLTIAQLGRPTLERYEFHIGGSRNYEVDFLDRNLGNGGASFRISLRSQAKVVELVAEIARHVPPDTITFALLVNGIHFYFYNESGDLIDQIVLEGDELWPGGYFVIGDSSDGYFQLRRKLRDIARTRLIVIELFGNYE